MRGNLQFSLWTLAGAIIFVAIGCVGVCRASDGWSQVLFTTALLAPLFGLVRIFYVRGASRAYAAGFVLLGWGYLLLVYGPWVGRSVQSQLATTKAMDYLHPLLMRQVPAPSPGSSGMPEMMMGGYGDYGMDYESGMDMYGGYGPMMGSAGGTITIGPNRDDLFRSGHSLFALLLGLAGAAFARLSYQTGMRQRRALAAEPTAPECR